MGTPSEQDRGPKIGILRRRKSPFWQARIAPFGSKGTVVRWTTGVRVERGEGAAASKERARAAAVQRAAVIVEIARAKGPPTPRRKEKVFYLPPEWRGVPGINGEVIYFIQAGGGPIKIGTTNKIGRRLENMQSGNHEPLALIGIIPGGWKIEGGLHVKFAADRKRGEWFNPSPALLDFIERLATKPETATARAEAAARRGIE
jgi:hypothetical protein